MTPLRRAKNHISHLVRAGILGCRILSSPGNYRFFYRWVKSFRQPFTIECAQPWFAFPAIEFLDQRLITGMKVFEYGSGMSTLFMVRRGVQCVSVEHDPRWYAKLKPLLATASAIDYRLVEPEVADPDSKADPSDPHMFASGGLTYFGWSFKKYVSEINHFPDESFDLVIVDGRARPACLYHSKTKVKKGGWLVLDNSDREYYLQQTAPFLRDFDRLVFRGPTPGLTAFTETSVFTRVK